MNILVDLKLFLNLLVYFTFIAFLSFSFSLIFSLPLFLTYLPQTKLTHSLLITIFYLLGKNADAMFQDIGHSEEAKKLLLTFKIGKVKVI